MKTYKPLKIFIASPGDLNEERNIFVNILSEVNTIKAHSIGYHLEPIGWENTLPGKGRPQKIINSDLITCDLFLMILWERWGTPSGKYSSGTLEEYYVALEKNKKDDKPNIWLFFKDIISESSQDIIMIKEFRDEIERKREVFYKLFKDSYEWQSLLRVLICKWLDTLGPMKEREITITDESEILVEVTFLDWINTKFRLKPEIYFTITDKTSFETWKKYDNKEQFIYNQLSEHLYLTLGAPLYYGMLRYKMQDGRYILLGSITFKYGDSLEDSNIYLPNNYNQIISPHEQEVKLTEFWRTN